MLDTAGSGDREKETGPCLPGGGVGAEAEWVSSLRLQCGVLAEWKERKVPMEVPVLRVLFQWGEHGVRGATSRLNTQKHFPDLLHLHSRLLIRAGDFGGSDLLLAPVFSGLGSAGAIPPGSPSTAHLVCR